MNRPPLTLEQYAIATAHVAYFKSEKPTAVVAQLGVKRSAWDQAERHWLIALQDDCDDLDAPLATSFSAAFSGAKTKLEQTKPRLEDVPPMMVARVGAPNAFSPVDVTAAEGIAALSDDALPFVEAQHVVPPAVADVSLAGIGMTQTVQALHVPDSTLPFNSSKTLGLTQYASLRAELAQSPEAKEVILARYDLRDAAAYGKVESSWTRRLANDPALQKQFNELFANYTTWLSARRGGRE